MVVVWWRCRRSVAGTCSQTFSPLRRSIVGRDCTDRACECPNVLLVRRRSTNAHDIVVEHVLDGRGDQVIARAVVVFGNVVS